MLLPPKPGTPRAPTAVPDSAVVRGGSVAWPERYPAAKGGGIIRPGDARGASELAGEVEHRFPARVYVSWLMELAAGRDPACTLDADGQRLPEDQVRSYVPVDGAVRKWALQEIGLRRWGRPKETLDLDVDVRGGLDVRAAVAVTIAPADLDGLSSEEVRAARDAWRKMADARRARLARASGE